jgi:hypothetical protein
VGRTRAQLHLNIVDVSLRAQFGKENRRDIIDNKMYNSLCFPFACDVMETILGVETYPSFSHTHGRPATDMT